MAIRRFSIRVPVPELDLICGAGDSLRLSSFPDGDLCALRRAALSAFRAPFPALADAAAPPTELLFLSALLAPGIFVSEMFKLVSFMFALFEIVLFVLA